MEFISGKKAGELTPQNFSILSGIMDSRNAKQKQLVRVRFFTAPALLPRHRLLPSSEDL